MQDVYASPELKDAEFVIVDRDNMEEDNGHFPPGHASRLNIDAELDKAIEGLVAVALGAVTMSLRSILGFVTVGAMFGVATSACHISADSVAFWIIGSSVWIGNAALYWLGVADGWKKGDGNDSHRQR